MTESNQETKADGEVTKFALSSKSAQPHGQRCPWHMHVYLLANLKYVNKLRKHIYAPWLYWRMSAVTAFVCILREIGIGTSSLSRRSGSGLGLCLSNPRSPRVIADIQVFGLT